VLERARSTSNGMSLAAAQAISVEAGMGYQMAFRSPGAPVIVPAVAHWKVGHFAALLGKVPAGRYFVGDPTFGEDIVISGATLDEQASGYFLVPPGPFPEGWRSVDASEGNTVWGRGDTGSNHDNGATGGQEIHAFPSCADGGCAMWNVEAMVDGLSLHDDPIGYTPPIGPKIRFPMEYSHRDAQQPMTFTYTNFGNKWTTGWLSYVTDDAQCAGFYGATVVGMSTGSVGGVVIDVVGAFCASLYRRGGGSEPYIFPTFEANNPQTLASPIGQFSQASLTRNVDSVGNVTSFVRNLPDGSVERFTVPLPGSGAGYLGTQYFMTEVDDPHGNAVKIKYDNEMRIVAITDAIGQVTTFCYNDSWQTQSSVCSQPQAATNPPSNFQVTQVTDPFGRSAFFGYDPATAHLTSITDVLGITSSFVYQKSSDFIDTLTTPYGTTQFAFTDSTNDRPREALAR
jgi:YD repeat-containing protein